MKFQCPACKGKRLNYLPWLGVIYECPNCGWRGPLGLEIRKTKKLKRI